VLIIKDQVKACQIGKPFLNEDVGYNRHQGDARCLFSVAYMYWIYLCSADTGGFQADWRFNPHQATPYFSIV
jgi:hypothetical protein